MQKLVGKLTRLDEAVPWISKLMSHLYTSLAFAHQSNAELLKETSSSFCKIIKQIKTKNFSCKPFELCNEESCKDDQQERAPLSNQRNYGRGIKFHFASLVTWFGNKIWNPDCTSDPKDTAGIDDWQQFDGCLQWLLNYPKILLASCISEGSSPADATPSGK